MCSLVTIALTALVLAAPAHGSNTIDREALHFVLHHRGGLVGPAHLISHLGDPVVLMMLSVIAALGLWRRIPMQMAVTPTVALVAASITETVAKHAVKRGRPPVVYHLVRESNFSFPSGHATGAAALLMAFAFVVAPTVPSRGHRASLVIGFAALAALVGVARLILGVHWLTDVVVGWTLGTAFAAATWLLMKRATRSRQPTETGSV